MKPSTELYRVIRIVLGLVLSCALTSALAGPTKLKVGTLAPKGSIYHRVLQEIGVQWQALQEDDARFIVYTDGSQGGEADIVRRMRVGQLDAGLLSAVGLAEIDSSAATLQFMPMMFRSWEEVDYVGKVVHAEMEQRLWDKGFAVLFWAEAGWVQTFSVAPVIHPEDFRKLKVFAWSGDTGQIRIMKSLGYRPIPLETNDILPALQTGLIEAAGATPIFALVSQIYGPAPHMLELNWAPVVGAAVITRKVWEQMSPATRDAVKAAASDAERKLRAQRERLDQEPVEAMVASGLKVHRMTPEIEREWSELAFSVYPQIRGNMVPADLFDEVQRLIRELRAAKAAIADVAN